MKMYNGVSQAGKVEVGTDRQTGRQTDRQKTNTHTQSRMDGWTDRKRETETEKHRYVGNI